MAEKEFTIDIRKPETLVFLAFLGIVLFLELQVSLYTPISFGDEGFHTRMAQWIGQNVEYPVWIPFTQNLAWKSGFDRPPFWNILEAGMFWLFGFSEAIPRLLTPFVSVLGGLALYLGAKRLYNERIGFVAAVMMVTFSSVVTYALVFYTDALVTFFMLMFMIMTALAHASGRKLHMLAAGTFGALAIMTKVVGYAAYALVAMMLLYELLRNRKPLELLGKYWPMMLVMVLLPAGHMLRNYVSYGTPICYELPLLSRTIFDTSGCNVDTYTSTNKYSGRTDQVGTETSVFGMGLTNYLEFAYGNLWFVFVTFLAGLAMMADPIRKAWSRGELLPEVGVIDFMMLAMLAIYAGLFLSGTITPRAEDTARFSLIWAPVVALVAAKYLDAAYEFVKKLGVDLPSVAIAATLVFFSSYITYAQFGVIWMVVLVTCTVAVIALTKNMALSIIILVLVVGFAGCVVKAATMYQVKEFSPLFFEACDWIEANTPQDSLLSTVWTYRAAYSCQRNVVESMADMALSSDVDSILATTKKVGITHIFVQKFSLSDQSLSEKYPVSYVRLLEANADHFKKVFENGPSLDECLQQGGCDGNIVYQIVY